MKGFDDREIDLSSIYGIAPVKVGKAGFAGEEIVLDGNLSEWPGFPNKVNSFSPRTGTDSDYRGAKRSDQRIHSAAAYCGVVISAHHSATA